MSRSNLTILERNTLLGFELESTQNLYLRGSQINERLAFNMANVWEKKLAPILAAMVTASAGMYKHNQHVSKSQEKTADEVMEFIMNRHFYSYFPNQ